MRPEEVLDRYNSMVSERSVYLPLLQEIADYMLPRKSNISTRRSPGVKQTIFQFDSTAEKAGQDLAAAMNSALTSASAQWFSLKISDPKYEDDKEICEYLEDCTDRMNRAFLSSNFHHEAHEIYIDLSFFATGALFMDEKPLRQAGFNGLHFKALTMGEYVVDEDEDGFVDTLFREFRLPAKAIVKKFGEKNVGSSIMDTFRNRPNEKLSIVHAVYPSFVDPQRKQPFPWVSEYIYPTTKKLLSRGGYHEFPFAVPRWLKTSGEIYGRGPGHTALPDVRTLNKLVELSLKALAKDIDPPALVHEDLVGTMDLTPGAQNPGGANPKDAWVPMMSGTKWDIEQIKLAELRGSIQRIFFADQLQMQEKPNMTAYEVSVRYELMQRLLGPTLGRVIREFLNPIIERSYNIMFRASQATQFQRGPFRRPPEKLLQLAREGNDHQHVDYEGPMARAQKSPQVVAIQQYVQTAAALAETFPEALDKVNIDEAMDFSGHVLGVPEKVIRSNDEAKEIRDARNQAAKEKADLDAATQVAGAAKQGAAAIKDIGPEGSKGILQLIGGGQ